MTALHAPDRLHTFPTSQDRVSLRRVFATIDAESCPLTYNFHMHTSHSDGQLRPDILIQQAIDIGLKGLAITDHHQITGFYAAQDYLVECQRSATEANAEINAEPLDLPHLWTGVEITSLLLDVHVHILGYAFNPHHPALADYLTGEEPQGERAIAERVVSAIHQAGGIAVLAHPARYRKSKEALIPAAIGIGIDGVETYYAYNNPKPWAPSADQTAEVEQITQTYQLLRTCGTDTHGLNLLHRV
jgi:predicted metal-dependent phosphoesterase TrpH